VDSTKTILVITQSELPLDGPWSGQDSLPVAGPDTDPTPAGMAQVLSELLGRTAGFQQIPVAEYMAAAMPGTG
jgi:hypothetical protein